MAYLDVACNILTEIDLHPRGSSFLMEDVRALVGIANVNGISLITNTGHIETLQKAENYDRMKAEMGIQDIFRRMGKETGLKKSAFVKRVLQSLEKERILTWKK